VNTAVPSTTESVAAPAPDAAVRAVPRPSAAASDAVRTGVTDDRRWVILAALVTHLALMRLMTSPLADLKPKDFFSD
jgi:hypothetical protein